MTEAAPYHINVELIEAEEKLIKAAQENPRDFEPLYKKYYERITQFIYHRLGNKELSFEITSLVFYKALDNLSKYKNKGVPFSAWLFRISINELNQLYRKNKVQSFVNIDSLGLADLKETIEEILPEDKDEQLFVALQDLPEDELELVNMRFFEKRSFKEIGEINEMGESACKMKLYRVLDKLKVKLTTLNQ